jgi:hypothetical protein
MVALEQCDITQQKAHADIVHGAPGQHLLGQRHGGFAPFCFVPLAHQAQQGAVRQAQEGPVVHPMTRTLHLTPCRQRSDEA